MKRYYSSVKPYYKRRRLWLFNRLIAKFMGLSYKNKIEVRFKEPLPAGESVVLAPNHAREFGPISIFYNYKRANRMWLNSNLLFVKDIPNHMMKDFFINEKGIKRVLCKILSYIVAPLLSSAFKSIEVIPVFRDARIKTTLKKTNETLISGMDVVIFPESNLPDKNYKYVNKLQEGFAFSAQYYYSETGRRLKYYPTYVCKSLKIISIGRPVEYDPDANFRKERVRISKHIMDEIEQLAAELPSHEITPYGEIPKSEEAMNEYKERKSKYDH